MIIFYYKTKQHSQFLISCSYYSIYPTKLIMGILLIFLLLTYSTLIAYCQTIVETLPGYPGPLPFKLETGYIGVGDNEVVQLFYYFVESEGNPEEDPLIIWLPGGPGCSCLRGFFFEIGPLRIQHGNYRDNVPASQLDENSWTKVANIIYLDAPTLTGYSYTKNSEATPSNDITSASQTIEFIRKFLKTHPNFLKNPLYVAGISYSGTVIPIITEELYKGNDKELEPIVNIQGYIAANPLTDKIGAINSRLEYAYGVGLISKELYESTKRDCKGEFVEVDSSNFQCMMDIAEVNKRISDINFQHVLDPNCDPPHSIFAGGNPTITESGKSLRSNMIKILPTQTLLKDTFCRDDYCHSLMSLWANDGNVRKALDVREGTVKEWVPCNLDMTYRYGILSRPLYEFNVRSSITYHEELSKRNCRALIFSGDHDMVVPHMATRNWINSLNLTITDSNWDAWFVNGQVAGYKTTYARDNYTLVFATVKGAGHTASEFKPKECFELVKMWFARRPI